jgi:hypothetical protein
VKLELMLRFTRNRGVSYSGKGFQHAGRAGMNFFLFFLAWLVHFVVLFVSVDVVSSLSLPAQIPV